MDAKTVMAFILALFSLGFSIGLNAQVADSVTISDLHLHKSEGFDSIILSSLDSLEIIAEPDSLFPLVHRVFYPLSSGQQWGRSQRNDILSERFVAPLDLNYSTLFPERNVDFAEFSNVGYNGRALILPSLSSDRGLISAVDRMVYPVEDMPFYDVPSPFTQLAFRLNYNEGQYSRFAHARSFDANRGIFFSYERSNSQGAYARQQSLQNNALLNGYGVLGKGKWLAWARWMGWKQEENGGISDREAFINNTITDRLIFPVQLAGAESYRRIRNYGGQYSREIKGGWTLKAGATHDRHRYDYSDNSPEENYYHAIFRDSTATLDSMIWAATNLSFALSTLDSSRLQGQLRVSLHRDNFESADVEAFANWAQIEGRIQTDLGSLGMEGNAWLNLGDYFGSTYGANLGLTDSIWGRKVYIKLEHRYDRPGLFWSQLYFNHAQWVRIPQIIVGSSVHGSINLNANHRMELGWDRRLNYIYLSENRMPSQQDLALLYAKWDGTWAFWSKWHLDAHLRVQSYSYSGSVDPLRIPNLHGMAALYLEDDWFAGALNLQMGVRGRMFSRGTAMEYAPELGYSIASQENIQVGGYPLVDVFLHGRIRTFYAYLLFQHASKGLSGYDYFATAYQPLPERSFRIGLSWKFFN
jgi:hypothetical protein